MSAVKRLIAINHIQNIMGINNIIYMGIRMYIYYVYIQYLTEVSKLRGVL